MGPALQTSIIIFCIIMSAYFSATETAFSSFNKIRVKGLAEKGNKRATMVLKLSENYDTLLSAILIGNNIVNILSASLATILFIDLIGNLGTTVSTIVMTVLVLIFGEISPKTIAKKKPEAFALFSAPFISFLMTILTPFTYLFKMWQNLIAKLIKSGDDQGITEEELVSIIEEAEESGDIDKEESTLIKSAIEFNDLEVGDILPAKVTHLEPFGAFCDIGCGIPSLIAIDCISVSRISHPSDRFFPGQEILSAIRARDERRLGARG
ncbi:MAG: DUF21 domain-containing protein, partial [Clostridia bacterium]|nr:DUF21 domain-containing protein [Clostridia bacterium]